MIKIGSFQLNTSIFLSPLSGCADTAFRLISREHGAKFCFYEMVDAHSLIYERPGTYRLLKSHKDDEPIAAQLLGADPSIMLDAAQKMLTIVKTPFLDINCACPVKKVIKKKAGAYLLKDTASLSKLLKKLADHLPVPVTVKMRIGFDKIDIEHIADIARRCEASGAAAIFVHGRTQAQGYAGDIDYASIRAIKEAVRIPVIGAGNILSPELAKKMFDETACDGIAVARGAFGNPWIFEDIDSYLKTGKVPPKKTVAEKKRVLKKHLSYVNTYKELRPETKVGFMRKVAMWYLREFSNAKRIRQRISSAREYAALLDIVEKSE